MKTIEEAKNWLIENRVSKDGNLILNELDFSDFDGDVYIGLMKIKHNLYQSGQEVKGSLDQSCQRVQGNLYQSCQRVQGNLYQSCQRVQGNLYQSCQEVKGSLDQSCQEIQGFLEQDYQKVQGDLYQGLQEVQGGFITQTLKDDEEYKINEFGDNCIVKKTKKHTLEELKKIVGYDFEIVDKEENK